MQTERKKQEWFILDWKQKAAALGIPLLFFSVSSIYLYRGTRSLSSLDQAYGVVEKSEIVQGGGRSKPWELLLHLHHHDTVFGIYTGQNQNRVESLKSKVQIQDTITVYYDASGIESDGVNLHVYQLAKAHQVLYSIEEKRSGDLLMGTMSCLVGTAFSILIIISTRRRK